MSSAARKTGSSEARKTGPSEAHVVGPNQARRTASGDARVVDSSAANGNGGVTAMPPAQTNGVSLVPLPGRRMPVVQRGGRVPGGATGEASRVACFVAGAENRLVAAVVRRLIDSLDSDDAHAVRLPSTIVLTGPSGSGKTHLAQGLAELWRSRRGPATVAWFTAGDFGREYTEAISAGRVRDFRRGLRRTPLVVIDDAHRLGDNPHRAAELQNTIDAVGEAGGRVLLTLNGAPADAAEFSRPLLSRLAGGLVLRIDPLGLDARRELLRHATAAAGCALAEQALETLAQQLPPEPPRVLRAAVELRRRQGVRVDAAGADKLLRDDKPTSTPPLRDILRVVARYHHVPMAVLTSASRKQGVVAARAVAIYLARELTPMSYAQIGHMLGGRDHTTVLHNYRRIARELPKDRALRSAVDDLRRLLTPQRPGSVDWRHAD